MRRITIEFDPEGRGFDLIDEYGRRWGDSPSGCNLTFGEMLEILVKTIRPPALSPLWPHLTEAEWAERRRQRALRSGNPEDETPW